MEINQLKYFKAVAETGKIVLAAEQLFVTSSAISSSISGLEKELGMPLFVRKGNRLLLNRQGKILLGYAKHILQYVEDAQSDLEESLWESPNHVIVNATASYVLQEMLTEFSLKYPEISLATATMAMKKISSGAALSSSAEFLLAAEEEVPENYEKTYESVCLFEDTPVVMVSPEHPLAKREIVEPEELAGQALIWPRASYNVMKKIRQIFEKRELPVPGFSSLTQQVSISLVKRNAGVALTTAHVKSNYTEGVCLIPLNAPECSWSYRLYWKKDDDLIPVAENFINFAKEFYGK